VANNRQKVTVTDFTMKLNRASQQCNNVNGV